METRQLRLPEIEREEERRPYCDHHSLYCNIFKLLLKLRPVKTIAATDGGFREA